MEEARFVVRTDQVQEEGRRPRRCIICGEPTSSGLLIRGRRICADCELDIVSTGVEDLAYSHYVEQLKGLLPETGLGGPG